MLTEENCRQRNRQTSPMIATPALGFQTVISVRHEPAPQTRGVCFSGRRQGFLFKIFLCITTETLVIRLKLDRPHFCQCWIAQLLKWSNCGQTSVLTIVLYQAARNDANNNPTINTVVPSVPWTPREMGRPTSSVASRWWDLQDVR